ncbi:MAG: CRTAC1 family protein [Thermoguttaceae bacterium]
MLFAGHALCAGLRPVSAMLVASATLLVLEAAGCHARNAPPLPVDPGGQSPSSSAPAGPPPRVLLHDVTEETGIDFVHTAGGDGNMYIVETVTAGLALLDYDMDGDEDIYFLNGAPLPLGRQVPGPPPANALYRNDGQWRFTDVTDRAGVGDTGYGLGVAVADYDNDGDPDIYVNNFGPNVLYRNNGDGTFENVTARAGIPAEQKVGAGACFFDMDADGDLDLYSANYVKFSYELNPKRYIGGFLRFPGPMDFKPEPDDLYRNNGDGTFTDVSHESGIGAHAGTGMGMTVCDYDNDGDLDIFICNDVAANFFFRNDGTGKFEEVGLQIGVAYNSFGRANGSMGVDCADYDRDGWLDFFMTTYQAELPVLYRNLGDGLLDDVSLIAGVADRCLENIKWGVGFADFDRDGWPDIYVANGHIEPRIDEYDDTTTFRALNALLLNTGDGRFVNIANVAGSGMQVRASSRGVGLGDLDDDGDSDVVVLNTGDKPTLIRNDTSNENHWLQIQLTGVHDNRDGNGARVTVTAGDLVQIDEVRNGRGYQGHFGTRLHFGLGGHQRVDCIEVRWLRGRVDTLDHVPADRLLKIVESAP